MSHTVRATWALWGRSGYLTGSRSHSFQLQSTVGERGQDQVLYSSEGGHKIVVQTHSRIDTNSSIGPNLIRFYLRVAHQIIALKVYKPRPKRVQLSACFCEDPLEYPQESLVVPKPHFENHSISAYLRESLHSMLQKGMTKKKVISHCISCFKLRLNDKN